MFAAGYPEAVSLAALIASPQWRQRASGDSAQRREFLAEACRRLGRACDDNDPGNQAIMHWMRYDSHHPPSKPDKTFPQTREHGATRSLLPSPLSVARTGRSADWFACNRRGGTVILYHRHVTPVRGRDWAPEMDGITATIAASGSTINFGPKTPGTW
ncbi:hypothetical protein ACQI5H_23285 [Mycobacterium heidelbergense]|uniref:hypothetical protein n=1 Tax=Mycobacterium heidelbergense TaxID=53376 RepID=UPI003CEFD97F